MSAESWPAGSPSRAPSADQIERYRRPRGTKSAGEHKSARRRPVARLSAELPTSAEKLRCFPQGSGGSRQAGDAEHGSSSGCQGAFPSSKGGTDRHGAKHFTRRLRRPGYALALAVLSESIEMVTAGLDPNEYLPSQAAARGPRLVRASPTPLRAANLLTYGRGNGPRRRNTSVP